MHILFHLKGKQNQLNTHLLLDMKLMKVIIKAWLLLRAAVQTIKMDCCPPTYASYQAGCEEERDFFIVFAAIKKETIIDHVISSHVM
mmetsp:Transcript_13505/g.29351  ORF Transcript_13505/g.29351 Transcript_13505/m.29351 type:complete len:87 (-) Transcript_13505:115-375(-)